MGEWVLTKSATISCNHMISITPGSGQSKLKAGSAVLIDGDLTGASLSGTCPNSGSSSQVPCATAKKQSAGEATKLKVNGKFVLLKSLSGQTNGSTSGTPSTYSASDAGQSKLKAT